MANIDTKNPNKPTSAGGVEQQNGQKSAPLIAESKTVVSPPPVSNYVTPVSTGLSAPKTALRSIEVPAIETAPELVHVFIATFSVREPNAGKIRTEIVEVPHTQKPLVDQNEAWSIIKRRFPHVGIGNIRRTAGRVVSRPGGKNPVILVREGETIRQLFPDRSEFEAARTVGTVIFDGALCDVILRHLRAKSAFAVTLRQPGGTVVNFSEQITTNRLTAELPKIIAEIVGTQAQTLRLYLHKANE